MPGWRWIGDEAVAAAGGLAGDEVLAQRVGAAVSPPTLRLYSYAPHCALVGRFQDVEHELNVAACRARGVAINRRPTGGGAILMGPDQLGVALAVDGRGGNQVGRPRELMRGFARALILGLERLDVPVVFRGKNDLEVGGRKLAGLGIYRDPSGGLLFHASVLIDLDVELMTQVLRTPFKEITERERRVIGRRTTTVREYAKGVAFADVRAAVLAGCAAAFDVDLDAGEFEADERAAIAALCATKYATAEWIGQSTPVADTVGRGVHRSAVGTVEVHVAAAGPKLKQVLVRGDFFADEAVLADLEWRLRWHGSEVEAIDRTLAAWVARHASAADLRAPLRAALLAAVASLEPYGCFVTPGGGR